MIDQVIAAARRVVDEEGHAARSTINSYEEAVAAQAVQRAFGNFINELEALRDEHAR